MVIFSTHKDIDNLCQLFSYDTDALALSRERASEVPTLLTQDLATPFA